MATIKIIIEDTETYPHRVERKEVFQKELNNGGNVVDSFNVLSDLAKDFEAVIDKRNVERTMHVALYLAKKEQIDVDGSGMTREQMHNEKRCGCGATRQCAYILWETDKIDDKEFIGRVTDY